MKIFPAVDIKDGKAVRLTRGDYSRVKVYDNEPAAAAREFARLGARYLHVVDLDGAKLGAPVNGDAVKSIINAADMFIEVGGGIRNEESVAALLNAGASRVILGTAALEDENFLRRMISVYGNRIAVGVDALDGRVATSGWLNVSDCDSVAFCERLAEMGVSTVIYTDISRDGTLSGTNLEVYKRLARIDGLDIVASGGISSTEEIIALRDMGISAAIVGKAVYEGKVDLVAAIAAGEGKK